MTPRAAQPGSHAARRAALVSLAMSVILFGIKLAAWWSTGSSALLADAIESIVNIAAAGFASYTVAIAAQPADDDHPYGHGKAEFLSAAFEGALILVAATAIVTESILRLIEGPQLQQLGVGAALAALAAGGNAALGSYLLHIGRRTDSPALLADGRHVLSDVWTTAAALVGLALVRATGVAALDPIAALAVAGYILWTGWKVSRGALGGLLDETDFRFLRAIAEHLHRERRPEWIEIHQLRTWRSGSFRHIDLHMVVPRYWTIERGHAHGEALEHTLLDLVQGRGDVVVHIDPCLPAQCPGCAVEACPVRAAPFVERTALSVDVVTQEGDV